MSPESNENYEGNSFEYRLKEVSDDEIISILRYRDQFQPAAVKTAIKEALKRGIISSVDDLQSDEFKPQELPPRSLFPLGNNLEQNIMIIKSLCRIFYGFGIIPLLYGYFQFAERKAGMAIIAIVVGIIVIFLANRLDKTRKTAFSLMMLWVNLPAIAFAIYQLTTFGPPTIMDVVAMIIILFILMYTTIYAHKISEFIQKETASGKQNP